MARQSNTTALLQVLPLSQTENMTATNHPSYNEGFDLQGLLLWLLFGLFVLRVLRPKYERTRMWLRRHSVKFPTVSVQLAKYSINFMIGFSKQWLTKRQRILYKTLPAEMRLNRDRMIQLYPRKALDERFEALEGPVLSEDNIVAHVTAEGTTPIIILGRDEIVGLRTHAVHNISVMTLGAAERLNIVKSMARHPEECLPAGLREDEASDILGCVAQVPVRWQNLETEIDFYITVEPMQPDISIGLEVLLNNGLCQFYSQETVRRGESYITLPHPSVDLAIIENNANPEIVLGADFIKVDIKMYKTLIAVSGRPENVILKSFLRENRVRKSLCFTMIPAKPKGLALGLGFDTINVWNPVLKDRDRCIKNTDVQLTLGTNFLSANCSVIDYGRRILFLKDTLGDFVPLELSVANTPEKL